MYSFSQCFNLYNQFLDGDICFWHRFDTNFKAFSEAFNKIDPLILLIWTELTFQAIYLDLFIQISDLIQYEVFSKPGNAYAFLPMGLFCIWKTFPEFIKRQNFKVS